MIKITEKKSSKGNIFEIQYIDAGKIFSSRRIEVKSVILDYEDSKYYLLYNENMEPITEVFNYINFALNDKSENTRERYFYALKILYTYLFIFDLNLTSLTSNDISRLKYFLLGYSPKGYDVSINLLTQRQNKSVNIHLAVYRSFIEFLGIEDSTFFDKHTNSKKLYNSERDKHTKVKKYKNNLSVYKENKRVPKYISVEEMKTIVELVRKKYSLREECIIRLMYESGLRIGEVLGLTADDVVIEEEYIGVIYIRNRISDRNYQKAKSCMNVVSQEQYKTKGYRTEGYGYQKIYVDIELIDLINNYIEETHSVLRNEYKDNYYKHTIADRVRRKKLYEDDNYYIFLNSIGKAISAKSWSEIIKQIFIEVGIKIDKGRKKNNLNHRFRHGFAMFQVLYMKTGVLELKELMRHRNIESTLVYYCPSESDLIEKKNIISDSIYSNIPELNMKYER